MWTLLAACTPDPVETPDPHHPGTVEVRSLTADDPHALENDRRVLLELDAPASAALLCRARDDDRDRFVLEDAAVAASHEFHLQALRNDVTYDCAAGPTGTKGSAQPLQIDVGPADPSFDPILDYSGTPPAGWVLIGVETQGCKGPGALAIFDPEGRLRWDWPFEYTGLDYEARSMGDGVLFYGGDTYGPGPVELQLWDGVRLASDPPGDASFHHDAQPLDDGRFLVLEQRTMSAHGQQWIGFGLRAFDPVTNEVSWDWDSQSAVDQGALPVGYGDAWHANWIWWVDHGQGPKVYVSLCRLQEIARIDVGSGRVDWVMGTRGDWKLVDPDGAPLPDSEFTQCQHGLEISPDGTDLLAYDNGRQRGYSRVVEFRLDQDALVATKVREWTDGWFENELGDVDWLPDGTALVLQAHSECHDPNGERSELVQVDLDSGAERWRMGFTDPWMGTYRAQLVDGCSLFGNAGQCPALEARWDQLAPAFGL